MEVEDIVLLVERNMAQSTSQNSRHWSPHLKPFRVVRPTQRCKQLDKGWLRMPEVENKSPREDGSATYSDPRSPFLIYPCGPGRANPKVVRN